MAKSKQDPCNPRIMKLLTDKSSVKQEVFRKGKEFFQQIKGEVQEVANNLDNRICKIDDAVKVQFKDHSIFECELQISGDILIFNMHTNVFVFERGHSSWKTGYIREDNTRGYFAMINIYNFLADSLKFNREQDYGVLLGRIFINREGHFFVEGKRQLGFLFTNLANQKLDKERAKNIIDTAIIQSMEYDLTVPDYREVMLVSVREIQETSNELQIKTSKKVELGYYSRMQGRRKKF